MAAIITVALLMMIPSVLTSGGLWQFSADFPERSDVNHVKLLPLRVTSLDALTLCMRLASTDLDRDVILFSYASQLTSNELHVWFGQEGRYGFYIRDSVAHFKLPAPDDLLRHLCFTWESETGATTAWMDGQPSQTKVAAQGQSVHEPAIVMIGQDQDSLGDRFEAKQSFVGVQRDVHLWDRVLTADEIKSIAQGGAKLGGNIINWDRGHFEAEGGVQFKPVLSYFDLALMQPSRSCVTLTVHANVPLSDRALLLAAVVRLLCFAPFLRQVLFAPTKCTPSHSVNQRGGSPSL
ncbi:C-reactive protein-like [Stegostoma tigrinum]|uniref:C-reactive protein-like n=1 Tax=Stegostoma tigrinum TaxID=3053191 RepID=UPI0028709368|nr:C-reactive protein-like [Stegostoma tigrinum]